jgi:hypothetical protein
MILPHCTAGSDVYKGPARSQSCRTNLPAVSASSSPAGAGLLRIYWQIVLPLATPGLRRAHWEVPRLCSLLLPRRLRIAWSVAF